MSDMRYDVFIVGEAFTRADAINGICVIRDVYETLAGVHEDYTAYTWEMINDHHWISPRPISSRSPDAHLVIKRHRTRRERGG